MRECAVALKAAANERGYPLFLSAHVTKDNEIAGPKALEHLVDTVRRNDPSCHRKRTLRLCASRAWRRCSIWRPIGPRRVSARPTVAHALIDSETYLSSKPRMCL